MTPFTYPGCTAVFGHYDIFGRCACWACRCTHAGRTFTMADLAIRTEAMTPIIWPGLRDAAVWFDRYRTPPLLCLIRRIVGCVMRTRGARAAQTARRRRARTQWLASLRWA